MCREGFNVCMNYEFNLLHHVCVVSKRMRSAAVGMAPEGDDNISTSRWEIMVKKIFLYLTVYIGVYVTQNTRKEGSF